MRLPQGLPRIGGRRGQLVRGLYWLIAAPTILAVILGLWFAVRDLSHNVPASVAYGFRTATVSGEGHYVSAVGPRAAQAGMRSNDRIAGIDGQPLRAGASEFEIGDRLSAAGAQTVLQLIGKDGSRRAATLPRQPSPWTLADPSSGLPVWSYVITEMVAKESFPVVMLAASLLLIRRRRGDAETTLFAFALLMLCLRGGSLWWWDSNPIPRDVTQGWWMSGWLLAFLAIAGFPDGRFTSRPARMTAAVLLGLLVMGVILNLAVLVGMPVRTARLIGGLVSVLIVPAALGAAWAVLRRYRDMPPGPERQQIKWVVGGSCVTLIMLVVLILGEQIEIGRLLGRSTLGYLFFALSQLLAVLALPLGLIVSLLRFRLYDAEATISRSAVYAAMTVSLLAIFAATEKIVEALGQQYFGGSLGTIAGGIGAALAAVMIAPLHHRLSDWSEKRFQQGLVTLRNGLPLLMGDMRETATLKELGRAAVKRAETGVRARHAALLIGDKLEVARHIEPADIAAWRRAWEPPVAEGLDCDRDDPVFPLRLPLEADGCGRVGWLLLGPRPDGSFYGKDERAALAAIADPVARAIAIAAQREASRSQFEKRLGVLEAAIARLLGREDAPA